MKPGKPVTHSFDKVRRRLRISQASLGTGSAVTKSLVQCNVGNKSPVFLCALLPDKMESCHLDLEFEEADDVVFSVIGPRSVYLTGYYVSNDRHSAMNSDTYPFLFEIHAFSSFFGSHCFLQKSYRYGMSFEVSFLNFAHELHRHYNLGDIMMFICHTLSCEEICFFSFCCFEVDA